MLAAKAWPWPGRRSLLAAQPMLISCVRRRESQLPCRSLALHSESAIQRLRSDHGNKMIVHRRSVGRIAQAAHPGLSPEPTTTVRTRLSRKRQFRPRILSILISLAMFVLAGCDGHLIDSSSEDDQTTRVLRVIDGDTLRVAVSGTEESIRLIGVDAPESVDPHRPVECHGKEASDFMKSLVPPGTKIRLVLDVEPRDRYGRLLAYAYRAEDDLFLNAALLEDGYAEELSIAPNVAYRDQFKSLVDDARKQSRGLWKACSATKPRAS